MLAEVDRVRRTRPGDVPGQRHPPRAGRRSIAAPLELGTQIKQSRFAAPNLFPDLLGCEARGRAVPVSRRRMTLLARGALEQRVELVELSADAAADLFAELEDTFVRD